MLGVRESETACSHLLCSNAGRWSTITA